MEAVIRKVRGGATLPAKASPERRRLQRDEFMGETHCRRTDLGTWAFSKLNKRKASVLDPYVLYLVRR